MAWIHHTYRFFIHVLMYRVLWFTPLFLIESILRLLQNIFSIRDVQIFNYGTLYKNSIWILRLCYLFRYDAPIQSGVIESLYKYRRRKTLRKSKWLINLINAWYMTSPLREVMKPKFTADWSKIFVRCHARFQVNYNIRVVLLYRLLPHVYMYSISSTFSYPLTHLPKQNEKNNCLF